MSFPPNASTEQPTSQKDIAARAQLDQLHKVEHALAEANATIASLQRQIDSFENSTFWRITYPARIALNRAPRLARLMRLSLKSVWWIASGQFPARFRLYRLSQAQLHKSRASAELAAPATTAPDAVGAAELTNAPHTPQSGAGAASTLPTSDASESKPPAASVLAVSPLSMDFQPTRPLFFPRYAEPVLSIVIPTYGQVPVSLRCLQSIVDNPPTAPYEVIVAEDASGDPAITRLAEIRGLILIEQPRNLGFLKNCNDAAKKAAGRYLHFLNNDTEVLPGAFDALVTRLEADPAIGLTGSKLLFPDGRLQEAGGVIWNDASGWNVGRNDDPERAAYNWPHEVDYISGASILVPRDLFETLGGFDETFAPAYYEDTDLAFRVRQAGYRVIFEPKSRVIHHEGLSHGTDETTGVKAYQARNREIMLTRWKDTLEADHFSPGTHVLRATARGRHRRTILIVDHYVPEPDRDAGSRATMCVIRALLDAGWLVKFWPHAPRARTPYSPALEHLGVEILDYTSPPEFPEWIAANGADLDHVMLMRPTVARWYMPYLTTSPRPFLSFYGHDIHFLRMMREVDLTGDDTFRRDAEDMRDLEIDLWRQVDSIIYLAEYEAALVREILPDAPVHAVTPFCFRDGHPARAPSSGATILFVGGFAHPPNIDAAQWLAEEIMPRVLAVMPDARLILAGSKPAPAVLALASERVRVTGYVTDEELEALYASARVAAAPPRFGAGVKGKVVEALHHGLPLVTTATGAEGIPGIHDVCSVTDDPEAFANAIVSLLRDDALWRERSDRGRALIETQFSPRTLEESLLRALGEGAADRSR
ncbi:glycosyltransferase [Acetobacter sp. DsW_063]|uniref:glycosyltransferase n=1 Tax=Acetobacter sp. DsW_063 TaxID=1514894 RepID=UPI001E59F257|nr:glycosyltransferase [Acetobacter sp. DsW_063]